MLFGATLKQAQWLFWTMLTFALVILIFIVIHSSPEQFKSSTNQWEPVFTRFNPKVKTSQGWKEYDEINERVFLPMGYRLISDSKPIPVVKYWRQNQCDMVFREYLIIVQTQGNNERMTEEEIRRFSMDDLAVIDESLESSSPNNDSTVIWSHLEDLVRNLLDDVSKERMSLLVAYQQVNITGMNGLVISSSEPWVEVFALKNGASKVLSIQHQKVQVSNTDRVAYMHPLTMAQEWKMRQELYDFASITEVVASFGFGRFGTIDSQADLREVSKVRCFLKLKGLLFLTIPVGQDKIVYNSIRVYGKMRLAMMFAGFDLLKIYRNGHQIHWNEIDLQSKLETHMHTFVLRKK